MAESYTIQDCPLLLFIVTTCLKVSSLEKASQGNEVTPLETVGDSGSGSSTDPQVPVLRINQLDSFELDTSLEQLLWSNFSQCFQNFRPGLLTPVEPELRALLQLLLWRFTIYANSATVGQSLLSLRYHDTSHSGRYRPLSRGQKLGLAMLTVGPRWLQERTHSLLSMGVGGPLAGGDGGRLRQTLRRSLVLISGIAQVAGLINFLIFLRKGLHPALAERIVGARTVFSKPNTAREVTYQYMNRELLWHGFAEFLIFLLPLVNTGKVKAAACSLVFGRECADGDGAREGPGMRTECGFCGEWPTMPHTAGCSHVYCYYCIKSHAIADPYLACPRCGKETGQIQPVRVGL